MDGLGDQFLAGTAFSLQQYRRTARSDLGDQIENLEHRFALADDVLEVVALLQGPLELNVFLFGFMPGHGCAHIGEESSTPEIGAQGCRAGNFGRRCVHDPTVGGREECQMWEVPPVRPHANAQIPPSSSSSVNAGRKLLNYGA